ncbi:conserved hypothetical protein [Histoplasma capsulatum G186AR]|uniref:Uncharacterized protein n=2 Tax=Ajellomyces capsulatus TaxID=5037 RepID=C0NWK8_AJECG|nr:uncharacterized protein HCBG_07538 [Histoplasma capsulatum G186AR]EEH04313.1 conserved hypothetical protein [Histoplasma capsulatum G186AR]KAG5291271.1 hypothetical protein I7I52_08545 [Histoplasma capsulatum]QSS68574.1 hypothetical protein I7I50_08029 [Histoplasma capsulatum G186AR]
MPSTAGLNVAIYEDRGIYKHWLLFIDGPTEAEKFILQTMSCSGNYRFELENLDAHKLLNLSEMVHLCDVDTSEIRAITDVARAAVVHNKYPGYKCQDYVLDLLDGLEEKNIIDGDDAGYKKSKEVVKSKQEGLAWMNGRRRPVAGGT